MKLDKILESVAQGRIDISAAKENIKKIFDTRKTQIEKLSTHLTQNFQSLVFSPHIPGVDAKLSIFRGTEMSQDCIVSENQVLGSQCFGVRFSDTSEFNQNKITAVQLSEVGAVRSNFSHNNINLSRLHNFTLQEARFEDCRLTRSTLNEVSISESDFVSNKLIKSEFSRTIVNESRLSGNTFTLSTVKDCEFTNCDLQSIEFEDCEFVECVFTNVNIKGRAPLRIVGKKINGKTIHNCKTAEEFLTALDSLKPSEPVAEPMSVKQQTGVKMPPVQKQPARKGAEAVAHTGARQASSSKKHQNTPAKTPRKKTSTHNPSL